MCAAPVADLTVPGVLDDEDVYLLAVTAKVAAADDVILLTLGAPEGVELPGWAPGAHVDLCLDNGITRQYSLVGDPADRGSFTVGVLRAADSRGGSQYVHDDLEVGRTVRVRGPRNHFALVPADEYLFVAGGIGITPIAAMVRQVHAESRKWTLVYGGRTLSSMALLDELTGLGGDAVDVWPQDERGIIDLHTVLGDPRPGTVVYTCGPEPLLDAVETLCNQYWPTGALHLERFSPKRIDDSIDTEFEIELAQSGKRVTVPADVSVLSVLADNGIHVLSSCGEGTCGTCETPVLEGEPDHRDSVLTDEEHAANDCMMVCVSRSTCPLLVLDI